MRPLSPSSPHGPQKESLTAVTSARAADAVDEAGRLHTPCLPAAGLGRRAPSRNVEEAGGTFGAASWSDGDRPCVNTGRPSFALGVRRAF